MVQITGRAAETFGTPIRYADAVRFDVAFWASVYYTWKGGWLRSINLARDLRWQRV